MRARLIGFTLAAALGMIGLVALAATLLLPGPGARAAASAQIRSLIRQELRSTEGRSLMRQASEEVALSTAVRDQIESPRVQQRLYAFVQQALAAPESQKAMEDSLKKLLATPEVKRTLDDAVKRQVSSIVEKGTGGAGGAGGAGAAGGGT